MNHQSPNAGADPHPRQVERYIESLLIPSDPALTAAVQAADQAGLPAIAVSPAQGKLLMLLAMAVQARSILELGTLAGFSTIWLARAAAAHNGRVTTLEAEPKHAAVARSNIERAGLAKHVRIVEGPALDTLPKLATDGSAPFDLIFIDADKENYPAYLDWAIRLGRSGTLVIADNVVREGQVVNDASTDSRVIGARKFNQALADDPRIDGTIIQMVGAKEWDGMAFGVVR